MRSFVIVFLLPALDAGSGLRQTGEPVQIETLIAELPVEALAVAVLRQAARLDEQRPDAQGLGDDLGDLLAERRQSVGEPVRVYGLDLAPNGFLGPEGSLSGTTPYTPP